jgi:hypothetical protein
VADAHTLNPPRIEESRDAFIRTTGRYVFGGGFKHDRPKVSAVFAKPVVCVSIYVRIVGVVDALCDCVRDLPAQSGYSQGVARAAQSFGLHRRDNFKGCSVSSCFTALAPDTFNVKKAHDFSSATTSAAIKTVQ